MRQDLSSGMPNKFQERRYVLTSLKEGVYQPLTEEELNQFEYAHPEISQYWLQPEALDELQVDEKWKENGIEFYSWDNAAQVLINNLWNIPNAWIFHEPVDPKKLGIPKYFDIIKNPLDFGTIK